ncbi:MAG: ATP-dependent Clp protease adaptor ClpS [Spirochaetaceae bacterium]|nr:ATP-dependent Clp protease adaptor ClpS [Spirochaetaceae bacterium]
MGDPKEYNDSELLEEIREEVKEPDMWKVVLLNDDYTPRDFVVEILVSVFHKPPIEATKIMLDVHNKGRGMVGIYPYDIGNTKVTQVTLLAREREFPLKIILEKA